MTEGRFYLNPMFGKIFVSDAKKCSIYSIKDGQLLKEMKYYKYKRLNKEHDSGDPDISVYAQTGVSIWELKRQLSKDENGKIKEKLVVVHDIERMNPLTLDIYTF